MNQNEMIAVCMKLAEFSTGRHDARRDYEWKVSLGLWAAILASIKILEGRYIEWWVVPLIATVYAFLWLRGLWVANENDKSRAEHFRMSAENLLRDSQFPLTASPGRITICGWQWWFGFVRDWAMQFHLATTIILLYIAKYFIESVSKT